MLSCTHMMYACHVNIHTYTHTHWYRQHPRHACVQHTTWHTNTWQHDTDTWHMTRQHIHHRNNMTHDTRLMTHDTWNTRHTYHFAYHHTTHITRPIFVLTYHLIQFNTVDVMTHSWCGWRDVVLCTHDVWTCVSCECTYIHAYIHRYEQHRRDQTRHV